MKKGTVLTEKDFNNISWHDLRIYTISFPDEKLIFKIDLDYIINTEKTNDNNLFYNVSKCLLIFESVINIKINLEFEYSIGIEISGMNRTFVKKINDETNIYEYTIETDKSFIILESTGFSLNFISPPQLSSSYDLGR